MVVVCTVVAVLGRVSGGGSTGVNREVKERGPAPLEEKHRRVGEGRLLLSRPVAAGRRRLFRRVRARGRRSLEELREVRVGRRVELVGGAQVWGGLVCVGRGSAAVRLLLRRAGTQKGEPRGQRRVVQRRRVRRGLEPAVVVARMHQPARRMRGWCWCRRRRRRVEGPWQVAAACGGRRRPRGGILRGAPAQVGAQGRGWPAAPRRGLVAA